MEWADALGQLAQPFCHRTIFRPFAFRGRWVDLRGADGVGRPVWAGGLLLATKRPDSGAERRICALGDQSALLGHLGLVEARLAPTTRLLLAALHPTPPGGRDFLPGLEGGGAAGKNSACLVLVWW